ncbi:asparagine synthetase B [Erythrobacter sp. YT30]|uniref:asparagine synthetase B family protein n=1 Tax=Erythrobacter sp. YT30 TaxID=1735012 RepID=UPI000A9D7A3D|nr:asparagine synthase-related protein [Erythrobacter sp. YT30]
MTASLEWTFSVNRREGKAVCHHSSSLAEATGAFSHIDPNTGLCVAGMWRADNAEDLRAKLDTGESSETAPIIKAAWNKWGLQLATHLRGPFAIAVFDPKTHQTYLARDALGVEPLFLAREASTISAASCPRAARRGAQLSSIPDLQMVADFVRGEITSNSGTFHQGLTRLPPGHWMVICPDEERCERYWSLEAIAPTEPSSDAVSHFRELLAKETRLSGGLDDELAVLLSGGLDSSAVAALVANMRKRAQDITTLSLTYEGNPDWVDRPHIDAMRQTLAMEHRSLPSGARDPFADMDDLLTALDGPCFGYGVSVSTSLFEYAKGHNLKTVLHGHGGDEIVSYGIGRLNELAAAGQWLTLWRETAGASALTLQPRWKMFERYLVHRSEWRWLKSKIKREKSAVQEGTDIPAAGMPPPCPPEDDDPRPIQARPEHTERDVHIAALSNPLQPHALETIMLTGRFHGLKIGMPFMSRDLAEFSVSLPSHWKLRNGFTRYILREAIRPLVPASVANRRDKNDFSQDFVNGFCASSFARKWADPDNPVLTQYVSRQWLTENWAKVEREGANISIATARGLWRAAVLGRWLAMDRDAGILAETQG